MASEKAIKDLFNKAKESQFFRGIPESQIWESCQKYIDRSDEDIYIAIKNISLKDEEKTKTSEITQKKIEESQQKIKAMKKKELIDRNEEIKNADNMLEKLFEN